MHHLLKAALASVQPLQPQSIAPCVAVPEGLSFYYKPLSAADKNKVVLTGVGKTNGKETDLDLTKATIGRDSLMLALTVCDETGAPWGSKDEWALAESGFFQTVASFVRNLSKISDDETDEKK